mmetsp:Transcript_42236/g.139954  ORF Transcript_42236/g.139954 Transcript_42236/m.139954 type:complete len:210 (+) Transcript_42236:890-1519(+)
MPLWVRRWASVCSSSTPLAPTDARRAGCCTRRRTMVSAVCCSSASMGRTPQRVREALSSSPTATTPPSISCRRWRVGCSARRAAPLRVWRSTGRVCPTQTCPIFRAQAARKRLSISASRSRCSMRLSSPRQGQCYCHYRTCRRPRALTTSIRGGPSHHSHPSPTALVGTPANEPEARVFYSHHIPGCRHVGRSSVVFCASVYLSPWPLR